MEKFNDEAEPLPGRDDMASKISRLFRDFSRDTFLDGLTLGFGDGQDPANTPEGREEPPELAA